jgi:uncharacterized damage-inducible protein DinB
LQPDDKETDNKEVERSAMTRELERIEDQLRLSFEGEAWHGPAVLEVLAGVSADQAAARPIAGAHCIWEVTLHLAGTYRLLLSRLRGDGAPLLPQDDWPPLPAVTPENWSYTVESLRQLNLDLRRAVRAFAPERLDAPLVADPPYTAYTQFIGVTQHDLYHAGQIALLKRALGTLTL